MTARKLKDFLDTLTNEQLNLPIDVACEIKWHGSGDYMHRSEGVQARVVPELPFRKACIMISGEMREDQDACEDY